MYKELINELRESSMDLAEQDSLSALLLYAANVIESLAVKAEHLADIEREMKNQPVIAGTLAEPRVDFIGWVPIKSRPMTEEERKDWEENLGLKLADEDAVMFCSPLPDDGQEVLVYSKYGGCSMDTFYNDPDEGCYFEDRGDMDGVVAWMPLPPPPKGEE